jgi:hypothetical protein
MKSPPERLCVLPPTKCFCTFVLLVFVALIGAASDPSFDFVNVGLFQAGQLTWAGRGRWWYAAEGHALPGHDTDTCNLLEQGTPTVGVIEWHNLSRNFEQVAIGVALG